MHGYVGCILYHQSPRHQVGMGSLFRPTTQGEHGRPSSSPVPRLVGGGDAVCDAQADVPWPEGFGRNLRSKTRWFTGFCNSHQVSHFATFFIDARAEISVAESRLDILKNTQLERGTPSPGLRTRNALIFYCSLARIAPGFVSPPRFLLEGEGRSEERAPLARPRLFKTCSRVVLLLQVSTMILPQVHLRKPCYDFYFL